MDDAAQRHDPCYLHVLETLTLGWAELRKVRLWHRHHDTGCVEAYLFSPYFIEPNAIGQSTYAIGWREPPGALRTFKIERLERAELTREPYQIPPAFNPQDLLADAWGIWYTEAQPVEVVLRFHRRVAAARAGNPLAPLRSRCEEQPDGSLLWRGRIAEPQEMLPWIRGWGADVEVVEPEGLKNTLRCEAQRLAKLYQVEKSKG